MEENNNMFEIEDFNYFKKKIRDEISEIMEFMPLWRMKFRVRMNGELKEFFVVHGYDWLLPRLKEKIKEWNENAANPEQNPDNDNYAWYVRVR